METETIQAGLISCLVLVLFVGACGVVYYFSVIVHELGHLAAAWLVGWDPQTLCIGHGKRRTVFSIGSVDFQLGSRLSGGMVIACARDVAGFRIKQFVFVLGGLLASASLATLFYVGARVGEYHPLIGNSHGWLWLAVWFECWLLAANLWPYTINFAGERVPSDGLSLWQTFWLKKGDIPAILLGHAIHRSTRLVEKGLISEAREELRRGAANAETGLGSELNGTVYLVNLLLTADRDSEAEAECARILNEHPVGSRCRVEVLDMLAGIPVFFGRKEFIPQALEIIDVAIAEEPDKITLKGTKGSLLIDHGAVEEGVRFLEGVLAASDSENDQAISTWYLALAYQKLGRAKEAQQVLARAKRMYSSCVIARRIETEFWQSPLECDLAVSPYPAKNGAVESKLGR